MTRAAIALGSNLGNRSGHLDHALNRLADLGQIVGISRLYETAPIGGPDQDAYLNAVVVIDTSVPPERVLLSLHDIEAERERERTVRWGPRTLDLDLLLYGDQTIESDVLTVPHPRLTERRFVLQPLLDAWPDAQLPDGRTVESLARAVSGQEVDDLGPWVAADGSSGFGDRGGWWVVTQVVLLAALVGTVWWEAGDWSGWTVRSVLGLVLMAAGGFEAVFGLLHLGTSLTPYPEPLDLGDLVHGGMYRLVRHPIYGGITLGSLGLAVAVCGPASVVLSIGIGVFFWFKAGHEEERLLRRYPDYALYREATRKRLIPWLI